jgi:hypothetical protein
VVLTFELVDVQPDGTTTRKKPGEAHAVAERIRPHELEDVATALLRLRTAELGSGVPTSAVALAHALSLPPELTEARLRELATLESVGAAGVAPNRLDLLADAVALAFPYLLARHPDN